MRNVYTTGFCLPPVNAATFVYNLLSTFCRAGTRRRRRLVRTSFRQSLLGHLDKTRHEINANELSPILKGGTGRGRAAERIENDITRPSAS
jgi:hypothetical protein